MNDNAQSVPQTPEPIQPTTAPTPTKKRGHLGLIIVIILVIFVIIGIILLVSLGPWLLVLSAHVAVSTRPIDTSLSAVAQEICSRSGYTTLYQRPDLNDSAIIQCKFSDEYVGKMIYSITDEHEGKSGYYYTIRSSYLGETGRTIFEKHFSDYPYIYKQVGDNSETSTLILFAEANAEEAAVDKVVDNLYDFLLEFNQDNYMVTSMNIVIFYNENLKDVKDVKDYLVLSPVIGLQKTFPGGNGFGDYVLEPEKTPENTNWLIDHTELYPAATTDAIKNNRHTFFKIEQKRNKDKALYFTKEELRESLLNSFTE